jgi:small subunit ribosomal protein S6
LKKYEGLIVLDAALKEETEKELVERIQKEIEQTGGRVETVQKMGQRPFARISQKRSGGHYVNVIFQAPPTALAELTAKFHLDADLFRWQFTEVPKERKPKKKKAKKAAAVVAAGKA